MATNSPGEPHAAHHRHPDRLVGADALRLHATLVLGLALCIGAFIFELLRALGGNSFSWMYVFEWPLFAGFAVYMWWNLYNGNDRHRPSPVDDTDAGGDVDGGPEDRDLVAWNRYLQALEADERDRAGPSPASSDPNTPPSRR